MTGRRRRRRWGGDNIAPHNPQLFSLKGWAKEGGVRGGIVVRHQEYPVQTHVHTLAYTLISVHCAHTPIHTHLGALCTHSHTHSSGCTVHTLPYTLIWLPCAHTLPTLLIITRPNVGLADAFVRL